MLRIRQEQLAVVGSYDLTRFIDALAAQIDAEATRRRTPASGDGLACSGQSPPPAKPAPTRRLVQTLVERAVSYGIDDEVDVERFVRLSFARGPGFEQDAEMEWAMLLLEGTELGGAEKTALLFAELARRAS